MSEKQKADDDWVPIACTLPNADQPLRCAEFDDFFAEDVISVNQESPLQVRFELRPESEVAARAANLAAKESGCCSFFTFDLTIGKGTVSMAVSAEPGHEAVLAALGARARTKVGVGA